MLQDFLKKEIFKLPESEYRSLMVECFDPARTYESLKKITNAYVDKLKKKAKRMKAVSSAGVANELPGLSTSSTSSPAQSSKSVETLKVCELKSL